MLAGQAALEGNSSSALLWVDPSDSDITRLFAGYYSSTVPADPIEVRELKPSVAAVVDSSETWRAGELFESGVGYAYSADIATFTVTFPANLVLSQHLTPGLRADGGDGGRG